MKVKDFINEYLSQCDDTIICLHSLDGYSSTTFSIYEWREWNTPPKMEIPAMVYDCSQCEVSQILARVENYHYNLAVVIHISTDMEYENAE